MARLIGFKRIWTRYNYHPSTLHSRSATCTTLRCYIYTWTGNSARVRAHFLLRSNLFTITICTRLLFIYTTHVSCTLVTELCRTRDDTRRICSTRVREYIVFHRVQTRQFRRHRVVFPRQQRVIIVIIIVVIPLSIVCQSTLHIVTSRAHTVCPATSSMRYCKWYVLFARCNRGFVLSRISELFMPAREVFATHAATTDIVSGFIGSRCPILFPRLIEYTCSRVV